VADLPFFLFFFKTNAPSIFLGSLLSSLSAGIFVAPFPFIGAWGSFFSLVDFCSFSRSNSPPLSGRQKSFQDFFPPPWLKRPVFVSYQEASDPPSAALFPFRRRDKPPFPLASDFFFFFFFLDPDFSCETFFLFRKKILAPPFCHKAWVFFSPRWKSWLLTNPLFSAKGRGGHFFLFFPVNCLSSCAQSFSVPSRIRRGPLSIRLCPLREGTPPLFSNSFIQP